MSIASRIEAIEEHLTQDWQSIANIGGDTSVDNNIENISQALEGIYEEMPKVSASDIETTSLSPTRKGKMAIDLKGNTQQNGTPTPDTPIDIHVVSGNNSIDVCGANVWDEQWELGTFNTTTGVDVDLTTQIRSKNLINIFPSTLYYFRNPTSPNTKYWIMFYDKEGNIITGYNPSTNNAISGNSFRCDTSQPTIMTPTNASKMKFYLTSEYGATYNNDICINVNNASINGNYYHYEGATYPINLPNGMEMCWIPDTDYQDKIFKAIDGDSFYDTLDSATKQTLTTGDWYKYGAIEKRTIQGTNNWTDDSTYNCYAYPLGDVINTATQNSYSNLFVEKPIAKLSTEYGIYTKYTSILYVGYPNSTLQDFKDFLNQNNMILYYVKRIPTYTKITDTTLISQLEAIKYSYDSQTNISQTNNDLPFILDVSALKELS